MPRPSLRRSIGVSIATVTIVLGTFPRDLQDHPHWMKVAWVPFASGLLRPFDLVVNTILYVPFGFVLQAGRKGDARLWTAGCALALSAALEMAQVWSHSRFPSATDSAMNVAGALVGATWALRRQSRPERARDSVRRDA